MSLCFCVSSMGDTQDMSVSEATTVPQEDECVSSEQVGR